MNFDVEYIEKLAKILDSNNLSEIALEDGEQAILIKKEKEVVTTAVSAPVVQAVAPAVSAAPSAVVTPKEEVKVSKGTPITSPIVGTFYSASKPGAAPFVSVGDTIKADDVVCIVEAMKCMNEINAEVAGTILEICVQDGQTVEFGQVLMYVG